MQYLDNSVDKVLTIIHLCNIKKKKFLQNITCNLQILDAEELLRYGIRLSLPMRERLSPSHPRAVRIGFSCRSIWTHFSFKFSFHFFFISCQSFGYNSILCWIIVLIIIKENKILLTTTFFLSYNMYVFCRRYKILKKIERKNLLQQLPNGAVSQ